MRGKNGVLLLSLLACSGAAADEVAVVDSCKVSYAPGDYSGRLVKMTGTARVGFEESVFFPSECPGAEHFPFWLEVPAPDETVEDRPPAGTRVIYDAMFAHWRDRPESEWPWQVAVAAPPVKVVPDKRWRRFKRSLHNRGCSTNATMIGRVDYLPGAGFLIQDERGRVLQALAGYGHEDGYKARFVVSQVVEPGEKCTKRRPAE